MSNFSDRSRAATDRLARSFYSKFEKPTLKEGYQKIIHITNNNELLNYLCNDFGCDLSIIRHYIPCQFFKFPRTKHLWDTGAATRDDIIMSPKECELIYGSKSVECIITEKIDGANLGISLNSNYEIICQHRGSIITYATSKEYSRLKTWLENHTKILCEILTPQRDILFGEWCQVCDILF